MTRTEGYDHNGAGVVENRNRIMLKGVRSALLGATGGRCRYTEVWGSAFMATNDVINHTAYAGEKSPVQNAGGISFDVESEHSHIYGSRVIRYEAKERRDEKLDVSGRLSMYAGRSFVIPNGHRVIDLNWNHMSKRFDLGPTIDVKTVVVDDTSYPLKNLPIDGVQPKAFDHFIDMFDPRSTKIDVHEVQKILDHRGVTSTAGRSIEYLVKWKGYHQRESTWEPEPYLSECGAKSMLEKYKSINVSKVLHITADPDYLATAELVQRHKLTHSFDKCMESYKLELNAVIDLRMTELFGAERERVLREEKAVRLRMNPEPKDDGRLKMRLLVRGDCEPAEWTSNMSLDSPTPASSSIKMMVAMSDESTEEEEISLGDITTAFLKGDDYGPLERPRFVAYQQYRGAHLRVFKLRGSCYGQRDAPVRWHKTIVAWFISQGFVQSKNDVCLFRHPITRVKALVWVDDVMMRGVRKRTDVVWAALDAKFGLKCIEYLDMGVERTFLNISLMKSQLNDSTVYVMHQNNDVASFLSEHKVEGAPLIFGRVSWH